MTKNKELKIRLSEKELEIIDKKANICGLNRSQYVRKITKQGYIIMKNYDDIDNLVFEINKIGNNINQIARQANETDFVSKDDITYLRNKINEIYTLIERFYDEE